MIYDCFLFYNEFDILEIRLNELNSVVDKFVLIESPLTFTGKPKPCYFFEDKSGRFDKFKDKIINWAFDSGKNNELTAWQREHMQRDVIKSILVEDESLKDDDIVFFSDVEEINRKDTVAFVCDGIERGYYDAAILQHRTSYYYFNNTFIDNPCPMAKACSGKFFKGVTPSQFRDITGAIEEVTRIRTIKNCGWNFSNLGTPQQLKTKLEAFSHQEYKHLFTEENIAKNKAACTDLFERPGKQHEFHIIPLDDSFPEFILRNKERFKDYITGPEDLGLLQDLSAITKKHYPDGFPESKSTEEFYLPGVGFLPTADAHRKFGQELMDYSMGKKLQVYWFGYGGGAHYAEALRPLIEELGMQLVTIHEQANADVKWDRKTWLAELNKADIIILPCKVGGSAKSSNRLAQALSLGKPVICSPLASYLELESKYPDCCRFAREEIDWREALSYYATAARHVGSPIRKNAVKDYSIDSIGAKWVSLFSSDFKARKVVHRVTVDKEGKAGIKFGALSRHTQTVDIIIPTANNFELLKICVDSIRACTNVSYKIIIVDNGTGAGTYSATFVWAREQNDVLYVGSPARLVFSEAINMGIRSSDAKYVCLLNDDTIVSRGWVEEMIAVCGNGVGAVGVLSNCDKGWQHNISIKAGSVALLPGLNTLEEIRPVIPEIYKLGPDYTVKSERSPVHAQDWIAFYCTLIPRKVIDEVGFLDEGFRNSGEDVDYCKRITKAGYKIIQNYDAVVFHFGAVGRKQLEKENYEAYHAADRNTQNYLKDKHDNQGLIVLYSGKAWEKWDGDSVVKGIGGSETWQVMLAEEFSKLNYRVISFCDCPETCKTINGVRYMHYSEFHAFAWVNWIDLLISSRTTECLEYARASKKLVMVHDVYLTREGGLPPHDDKVDYYLCLSRAHKEYFSQWQHVQDSKILITSNGIDLDRFAKAAHPRKDKFKCIYSSSPDRGLEALLLMWPEIKRRVPEATLDIYYGFNNYWSLTDAWRVKMEELMKAPGVAYHGRVGQDELAKAFYSSKLLLYPCSFEETFCITALEAMAAGCIVLSSRYWGIQTTVNDVGILISIKSGKEVYEKEYQDVFISMAVEVLTEDDKGYYCEVEGPKRAATMTWKCVARQFITFLEKKEWKEIQ